MNLHGTLVAFGGSAALALTLTATASASTVSYLTAPPPCTTKSALQPSPVATRPTLTDDWWTRRTSLSSVMTMSFARGQTINDVPVFFDTPPVMTQTYDSPGASKAQPALPKSLANGQNTLVVSTCPSGA